MTTVAVIPARGGSKRLPRKNLLPFRGRPMIAWTIDAAQASGRFTSVVVSTEDDEIAAVAASVGATVLKRPHNIADDRSRLIDVLVHWLQQTDNAASLFCLLLANCPLREARHIREAHDVMEAAAADAVISVVRYGWTSPWRAMRLADRGLEPLFPDQYLQKSQAFPDVFCPSGAIYWSRTDVFRRHCSLYVAGLQPYVMPWYSAIDIDEPEDLRLAEGIAYCMDHGFQFE